MPPVPGYWNHNVHYQPVILGGVPPGCRAAIDVGEGTAGAPIREPDMPRAQVRETAGRLLPGVRHRRRLLWRYSLRWDRPAV